MDTNTQPRQPKGAPIGGQFAGKANPESDVTLGDPQGGSRPLREVARGQYMVTDTVMTELDREGPIRGVSLSLGGVPHRRAHAGAAALACTQREGPTVTYDNPELLRDLDGQHATVLIQEKASSSIYAREGTVLVQGDGSIALLNKGAKSKGFYLHGKRGSPYILGVRAGYGKQEELAAHYRQFEQDIPEVEAPTFDDIPLSTGDEEPPSEVAAVFIYDHPGFDGSQDGRGCAFFATDRDPEEVVNGYFIAPSSSGLYSEHGSFTVEDLKRHSGRVVDYQPGKLAFRDAMNLADTVSEADTMFPVWDAVR